MDWYGALAAHSALSCDAARQLHEAGFVVVPRAVDDRNLASLAAAYDAAVASSPPENVSIRSSTRVSDFVNRDPVFDGVYLFGPLLSACCRIIGRPFKLSSMHARTIEPGSPAQELHVDVAWGADAWPLVGFILMVDAFEPDNGATRFVPASHSTSEAPSAASDASQNLQADHARQVLACGSAGSMIIFNGSAWHGFTANRSGRRRRSVQGAFIPREGRAAVEWAARMRPETLLRIGPLARYLLDLPDGPHD